MRLGSARAMATLIAAVAVAASRDGMRKPNIILLLADDLGWNDVGFHGSNQIPTPNIDALAYTGIILDNYYVAPVCTPTRSALMTGRYPIHTGLQHSVIHGSTPYGLSPDEVMLPEYLKREDYATRAIGKWHLGHFREEYTPERRGFDSHYGFWLGRQDYYDHSSLDNNHYWGYDMKRGLNSSWSDYGTYSTDLFTDEAVKVIREHETSRPLFLYVAYQAVHSGNSYRPLQAPPEYIARFSHIEDNNRRIYAGMLSKLDESVGEIVSTLGERGMLENSIIIFSTDNGGPAAGFDDNAASNWPLRGVKSTMWQGGIKGVGLIWSPLLRSGVVSNALMHVTDWLPTLLQGIQSNDSLTNIDGFSLWRHFADGKRSPRNDILINIDPEENTSGLIYKNWKLIQGLGHTKNWDGWYGPSGRTGSYDWDALSKCKAALTIQKILPLPSKNKIEELRHKSSITCKMQEPKSSDEQAHSFLFDLINDPCETKNQISSETEIAQFMQNLLEKYRSTMVAPRNTPPDHRCNPKYWGYQWINWMDFVSPLT